MEAELPATSSQFSLSISIFILIQGIMPLLWTAVSEVKGRKVGPSSPHKYSFFWKIPACLRSLRGSVRYRECYCRSQPWYWAVCLDNFYSLQQGILILIDQSDRVTSSSGGGVIISAIQRIFASTHEFSCSSSAVMAIGAASLADIFDPEERGRKVGLNDNFL